VAPRLYLGIDLGTTNSAAAIFDGERVEMVRNAQGSPITPSVVRIDARGNVTVGARARRALDQDPDNVRTEFKRLMGTPHALRFAASRVEKRPEELSAEILRSMREDVRAQVGVLPTQAVISVPALFELPQTSATSEAARLAGFERVEMIQEPVASALAAGWKAESAEGPWLVYDLGGGTFDVSLLETQQGLVRVVGHDGDNFLGGRDFDAAVVDWAIEELATTEGVRLSRAEPAHALPLRRLRAAAEEAKIELTRAREAELALASLAVGDATVEVSLLLSRKRLEELVEPLIMRSLAVCGRLLATHGIVPGDGTLSHVVLVGGPTATPILRERVAQLLGAKVSDGFDPMTLVAQGAALYAASAGLDGHAVASVAAAPSGPRVWLQDPAMSPDLTPFVVGRLVDRADRAKVAAVVIRRADGGWVSEPEALDDEGSFATMINLAPRVQNELAIEGRGADGGTVAVSPATFTIVHGVTIGDPPLSRSIGLALANNNVRVFFERGSPLPMRRTFSLRTVEALSPRDPEGKIALPIVQGEFALASLCRLVGTLAVRSAELKSPLAAGSLLEVTMELDRGGRLSASARVPLTGQVFDHVVKLVAGTVAVEDLGVQLEDISRRVQKLRADAFRHGVRSAIETLAQADARLREVVRDAEAARGGDLDATEKARRALGDLDAMLAEAEGALAWPDLDADARRRVAVATAAIAEHGTPEERTVLAQSMAALDRARAAENAREVTRQVRVIRQLGFAAELRMPGAWEEHLDYMSGVVTEATDPRRAAEVVEQGRAAAARNDTAGVEKAVRELWRLTPRDEIQQALGHGSGVH
jgi:molecular chaperone DnaK